MKPLRKQENVNLNFFEIEQEAFDIIFSKTEFSTRQMLYKNGNMTKLDMQINIYDSVILEANEN